MPDATEVAGEEVSSKRATGRANWISAVVALLAAGIAFWQATEAKRATDDVQAERAANVYFERDPPNAAGRRYYYIRNTNDKQVANVSYRYELSDKPAGHVVFVGVIPPCSRVRLTPNNKADLDEDFTPYLLSHTDPAGHDWQRERTASPVPSVEQIPKKSNLDTSGTIEKLSDC